MGYVKEGQLINFQSPAVTNINSLKVYFKPKQAGTGDPSPSNVREIEGWTGLSVTHCGKNIYDRNTSSKWYIPDTLRNELFYYSLYIDNTNGTTLSKPQLRAYNANNSYISSGTGSWGINAGETGRTYVAFSLSNLLYSDQIVSLSFNPSHSKSKAKEYMMSLSSDITYEPYIGTTTPIDWSSTAGTLYGGYVDLVSGEVVEEYTGYKVLDGTEDVNSKSYTKYSTFLPSPESGDRFGAGRRFSKATSDALTTIYCDSLPISYDHSMEPPYLWVAENDNYIYYIVILGKVSEHYQEITNGSEANQYVRDWLKLHNVTVRYKSTPITYQLTPSQLSTIRGTNNIWSNANDILSIDYDVAETSRILTLKKQIIAAAPHIKTATGAIASFSTDTPGPLQSCRVSFTPTQSGSGDPSPSNVRAIQGWGGVEINRTNINLFNETLVTYGTWTSGAGVIDNTATYGCISKKIPVSGGNSVTVKMFGGAPYSMSIVEYDANGDYLTRMHVSSTDILQTTLWSSARYIALQIAISSSTTDTITSQYIAERRAMLVLDSNEPTEYIAFGTTIPTSWSSSLGTIYGGYIDLVKGELVEEYVKIDLLDASWDIGTTNYGIMAWMYPPKIKARNNCYCNILPPVTNPNITGVNGIDWNNSRLNLCLLSSYNVNTVNDLHMWLQSFADNGNRPIVVGRLDTPIIHTLTPQQLQSLRGQNNIWSNANGNITVQYYGH